MNKTQTIVDEDRGSHYSFIENSKTSQYVSNNLFWCVFLAKYPDNVKKSDELCRWWPDWCRYKRYPKSDDVLYGERVLIRPSTIPCSTNFVQWVTILPLNGFNTVFLVGPFTFEDMNASNRVRQKVNSSNWDLLIAACVIFGILPPTRHRPIAATTRHSKREKRKKPHFE